MCYTPGVGKGGNVLLLEVTCVSGQVAPDSPDGKQCPMHIIYIDRLQPVT